MTENSNESEKTLVNDTAVSIETESYEDDMKEVARMEARDLTNLKQ